jgi:hypothetical protein
VALKPGETADQYVLLEGMLAGGAYASVKLEGPYAEIVRQIAPTFELMREQYTRDPARLPIEFYKRHTEIILCLPIEAKHAGGWTEG